MVDRDVLSRKLSYIRSTVEELRSARDITWEVYRSDPRARAFVERLLHLAIEAVLDAANHLVSFEGWREPQGYRDLLAILAEKKIVPPTELSKFQEMASFRNLLVHRYDRIDDEVVFGVFQRRLGDFDRFVDLIQGWTQKGTEN